jgi:hypothetical protein
MVGLSPGHCVTPDMDDPVSLTQPTAPTQSAATASNIPADFIHADFNISSSLS